MMLIDKGRAKTVKLLFFSYSTMKGAMKKYNQTTPEMLEILILLPYYISITFFKKMRTLDFLTS